MTCLPALRRDKMEVRVQSADTGVIKTLVDYFSHFTLFSSKALLEDPLFPQLLSESTVMKQGSRYNV